MATPVTPIKRGRGEGDESGDLPMVSPRKIPKFDFWASLKKKSEVSEELTISSLKLGSNPQSALTLRVTYISRLFESKRGKSFYFYGMDSTGKIKFFSQGGNTEKHYDVIKYDGVYTLKGFVVTATNPAFLKEGGNALQVELMEASILDPVEVDVPGIVPNYVKLNLLDEKVGETIDLAAIITQVLDVKTITRSKDGMKVFRQEIQVTDDTMSIASLYFWGEHAGKILVAPCDVVEFRNLQVRKFNQESCLNFGEESLTIPDSEAEVVLALKAFLEDKQQEYSEAV